MRTTDEVYEKVLEVHGDVLGLRSDFIDLKEHVNDEVQSLSIMVASKQDANSLLTSILFQLLNHRGIRWSFGAITVAALGTIVSAHWLPWVEALSRLFR